MRRFTPRSRLAAIGAFCLALGTSLAAQQGTSGQWRVHGGDAGYTRYAALDQINADTVGDLQIVWRRRAVHESLHTRWPDLRYRNELRSTPIMVDGVLYASNGIGLVEAFDPGTGRTLWVQDASFLGDATPRGTASRGVAYWEAEDDTRIFSVRAPYLVAIDARTGRLVESFGGGPDLRCPDGLFRHVPTAGCP